MHDFNAAFNGTQQIMSVANVGSSYACNQKVVGSNWSMHGFDVLIIKNDKTK